MPVKAFLKLFGLSFQAFRIKSLIHNTEHLSYLFQNFFAAKKLTASQTLFTDLFMQLT